MTLAADQIMGNRYRLVDRIAGGGMGEVWRGRDDVLGREVAVKVLRRAYADDPVFLQRFRAEARHAANLSHPNIAAVYDFGEGDAGQSGEQGSPFLVMEHVPGEPLSALISRERTLDPGRTMHLVGQAALGLQAAHDAGVIHRDVKPGNILVTPDGDVKITDFGIARAANSVPLTQTGAIMGTAYYISPEQASGQSVTPASDVYSLGIVAYECLTGRRPFAGDTPVSVALAQVSKEPPALPGTVPAPVRELVMGMLAKEPEQRPTPAGRLGSEALALRAVGPDAAADRADDPTGATRVLPLGQGATGPDTPPAGTGRGGRDDPGAHHDADTDPGFRLPDPAGWPRWLVPALVLAAAAIAVLLLARACSSDPDQTVATTDRPTSPEATAPTSVDVAVQDYLGRPVAEVRTELEGLGLTVDVQRTAGGGPVGTVKGVAPTGTVAAGSLVTLDVVAAEPDQGPGDDGDDGDGDGAKGKGKGGDKGKGSDKRKGDE